MITNTDLKGTAMPAPIVAEVGQSPTTFEFDIAHHVPGRLRLRSAALKGKVRASEQARRHLAQIDGVTSASANPATGSVLLEYDPNVIGPAMSATCWQCTGVLSGSLRRKLTLEPGGPTNWRAPPEIGRSMRSQSGSHWR